MTATWKSQRAPAHKTAKVFSVCIWRHVSISFLHKNTTRCTLFSSVLLRIWRESFCHLSYYIVKNSLGLNKECIIFWRIYTLFPHILLQQLFNFIKQRKYFLFSQFLYLKSFQERKNLEKIGLYDKKKKRLCAQYTLFF